MLFNFSFWNFASLIDIRILLNFLSITTIVYNMYFLWYSCENEVIYLKKCPNCKMTVDGHTECPMCHADLLQEPYVDADNEKYKLNKYFLSHLFKCHKYPIFCALIVIVKTIWSYSEFNRFYLIALIFSIYSVTLSLYMKKFTLFYEKHIMMFHCFNIICVLVIFFGGFLNERERALYILVLIWIFAKFILAIFMHASPSASENNLEDYSVLINKIVKYASSSIAVLFVFLSDAIIPIITGTLHYFTIWKSLTILTFPRGSYSKSWDQIWYPMNNGNSTRYYEYISRFFVYTSLNTLSFK